MYILVHKHTDRSLRSWYYPVRPLVRQIRPRYVLSFIYHLLIISSKHTVSRSESITF